MRIEKLIAEKYGKFEGHSLDLPAPDSGRPDLHLVVGLNEAGKSTLRRGILELFYGFPQKGHAMSYRHGNETVVAADISDAGNSLHWRRTRRKKDPVVDASGSAVSLATYLGTTSVEEFEAMYCLDYEGLRSGAQTILSGQSDLGRLLFEAATGLQRLGTVQKDIEAASGKLIARHGATRTRFKELGEQARAADVARAAAEMLEPEFRQRVERRRKTNDALIAAREALGAARAEQTRLQRFSVLLPLLAVYREQESILAGVPDGVDLPADATVLLEKFEMDAADQALLVQDAEVYLEECETLLAQCPEPDAVIDHSDDIAAIVGKSEAPGSDLETLRGQHQTLVAHATALAISLGYGGMPLDELRDAVPTYAARLALQQALNVLNVARAGQESLGRQFDEAEAAVVDAQRLLVQSPPAEVPQELAAVLAAAAMVPGETDIESGSRQAQVALRDTLAGLLPWVGDADGLRALVPPGIDVFEDWESRESALTKQLTEVKETIRQATARRQASAGELRQLPDAAETGSRETLRNKRTARDTVWRSIRAGAVSISDGGADLELHTDASDREADALITHADQAARRVEHQRQIEASSLAVSDAAEEKARLEAAIEETREEIAAACGLLGLPALARSALRTWLVRRDAALLKADDARDRVVALDVRRHQIADARTDVERALVSAGLDPERLTVLRLPALVHLGREHIDVVRNQGEAHRSADRLAGSARAHLERIRLARSASGTALDEAREVWDSRMQEAALPAVVTDQTLISLLPQFDQLEKKLVEMQASEQRQGEIEAFLRGIADQLRSVAAKVGHPFETVPLKELEVSLLGRLRRATSAAEHRRETEEKKNRALAALRQAVSAAQRLKNAVEPLLNQAHTDKIAEAMAVAACSDARRACRKDLRAASDSLLRAAGGRSLEQVAAELAKQTPGEVEAAILGVNVELPGLEAARDLAQSAAEAADRAVEEVKGDGAAADAAATRVQVHTEMADVVRQYLRLRAAGFIIRRAVQIYREEKQGPVLELASRYFSELTNGSFERLVINEEGTNASLTCIRADAPPESRQVRIDGLSDGTRDQLFLALRLAGVDLQMRENQRRVPVVCDDLFVHFDDNRAESAFRALGALGGSTQVIYFTHHPHLVDIALKANSGWKVHYVSPAPPPSA